MTVSKMQLIAFGILSAAMKLIYSSDTSSSRELFWDTWHHFCCIPSKHHVVPVHSTAILDGNIDHYKLTSRQLLLTLSWL